MAQTIMKVAGTDGQLELMADRIVITRDGLWAKYSHGVGGKKEIPITSISTVEFKDAGLFGKGEIDFVYAGFRAGGKPNQNKVQFTKKEQEKFYAFKEKIFDLIQQAQRQNASGGK